MAELLDVSLVWETSYYDFVREGLGSWDGRPVRLVVVIDRHQEEPVRYDVYTLDQDEAAVWDERHRAFEKMVGTHCCRHLPRAERKVMRGDLAYWERYPAHERLPGGKLAGWVGAEAIRPA